MMNVLRKLLVLSWVLFFVATPVAEEEDYKDKNSKEYLILINTSESAVVFARYTGTRGFFGSLFSGIVEYRTLSLDPGECARIEPKEMNQTEIFSIYNGDIISECFSRECYERDFSTLRYPSYATFIIKRVRTISRAYLKRTCGPEEGLRILE